LPYAFASHFAPAQLMRALEVYRAEFRPSPQLARPHAMIGVNVVAAETDEQARFLSTSLEQAIVNLRSGRPGRLPPPRRDLAWGPAERAMLEDFMSCSAVGSPETVKRGLAAIADRTRPDELIVASQIFDHAARLRSYEMTAKA
jgi:luciferase family oxidoreductase group 1